MIYLICILFVCLSRLHAATQWPQFRGPDGQSIASETALPTQFGPNQNVLWKVMFPKGHASLAVWNDRIFTAAYEGQDLFMICLNRKSGKEEWRMVRQFPEVSEYEHVAGSPANSTPATDGERVVFYFDDFGLIVTDLEGELLWEKRMPSTANNFSYGASPLLDDGRIYLNRDGGLTSALLCFDAATGEEIWSNPRPGKIPSFTTPHVIHQPEGKQILMSGSGTLEAYDAQQGKRIWYVAGFPAFICPSPTAGEGIIVAGGWATAHADRQGRWESAFDDLTKIKPESKENPAAFVKQFDQNGDDKLTKEEFPPGRGRDAFNFLDKNRDGWLSIYEWGETYNTQQMFPGRNVVMGIRYGGKEDVTGSHVAWQKTRGIPYVCSPLIYQDHVYLVKTGGFVTCLDSKTGKVHYRQERLGTGGEYYASPLAVQDRILICAQRGTVFTIKAGPVFEKLMEVNLREPILATPSVIGDTLYIRTERHVWAFKDVP